MFTGIIKSIGTVKKLNREGSNLHISIQSDITNQLQIDQSVAHNGVCLTVVDIQDDIYTVTAIEETLAITNLLHCKKGDEMNLELAMKNDFRLDGHLVQGHVDQTASCTKIEERNGSWEFSFKMDETPKFLLVNKGSICIDGVSLTVVKAEKDAFQVAIIPYTYENTIFKNYMQKSCVNVEYDIIGKYVQRQMKHYQTVLK